MPDFSKLGDGALLAPAALVLLAMFAAVRRVRVAAAFGAALAICVAATVAAKLVFKTCGGAISDMDVASPSGHVSLATLLYGAAAVAFGAGRPRALRWAFLAGAAALVAAIGASRVSTRAHSAEEVAAGLAIGGAALGMFAVLFRRAGAPGVPAWPLLAALAAVAALLYGRHFSLEPVLGRVAGFARSGLDICVESPAPRRSAEGWRLAAD